MLGEQVAISNRMIRRRLIEKLTFGLRLEETDLHGYLWVLLFKALRQDLAAELEQ